MFSFHVWIVLRETTVEADTGSLTRRIQQLELMVQSSLPDVVPKSRVHAVNVERVLQFSGSHNHRGDVHQRLESVLNGVAVDLPGSYGLAYCYDDEDPAGDGFNVIVIARGSLRNERDEFLSPVIPRIED